MNKKLLMSLLTLSTTFALAACGNNDDSEETTTAAEETTTEETTSAAEETTTEEEAATTELQDGTYRVEAAEADEHGYKDALEITVADGKITEASWESKDEDGNEKIDDDDYQETMSGVSGVGPQDFIPALEDSLVETQSAEDVEVVTGATNSSTEFKEFAQKAIDAAEEGNTETIVVESEAE